MSRAKYHIIRLSVGQECPAGYDSRTVRGATICSKKLSAEEVAFAAAASVPEMAPVADSNVDDLERLMSSMGMGGQAVVEWGGEAMNQDGGRRKQSGRKRITRKRSSRKQSGRKRSGHKGASRRSKSHRH
jgi:hypothetical protein